MRNLPSLLVVLALILVASAREAAPQGRRRSSGGGDSEAERAKRADQLIVWFDANRDGVIEPNEVHGQRRYVYERMAKEAGLDPTHSLSVGEFRTAVARHFEKAAKGEGKPATPVAKDSSNQKSSGSSSGSPSVAGFGSPTDKPAVAGFAAPTGTASPSTQGTSSPSRSAPSNFSPSSSSKDSKVDSRIRKYAASLLKRYDANKNGVLEKDEWKDMRGSPEQGDSNHDGVITLDELTARLSSYGSKDSSSSASSSTSSTSSSSSSGSRSHSPSSRPRWGSPSSSGSSAPGERKTYRFLSPTERLPKGLPDWFARKDADGDGQVSMAEYSTLWDDSKVSEFEGYDGNRDGVITPQECLDAEESK